MKKSIYILALSGIILFQACTGRQDGSSKISAEEILGNPDYVAMSWGGYREKTRDVVPSIEEIKEDMLILNAMGVKLIRTYNTQQYNQAINLLKAISELKNEVEGFEMYVMLGAWIDCDGAWTDTRNHSIGDTINNRAEIAAAVEMANDYPEIVKIIAVGNEAMVHWAEAYYVEPNVILKWVQYLQNLKLEGKLPSKLYITSSDNFASWGGGDESYHNEDLVELIKTVDFVSMHTYPFHDSHYNPDYWTVPADEKDLSDLEKIGKAMQRAKEYAAMQYNSVRTYIESLGIDKPIHIGETGWASVDDSLYGLEGSKAADEYKQALYYKYIREWTKELGMSCFYFEAFDEQWKDSTNVAGSENHLGLISLQGVAKYAIWELFDQGVFEGLERDGKKITKSFGGDFDLLFKSVGVPPNEQQAEASPNH